MIQNILVVGGANGIGLSIAEEMALRDTTQHVYIVDKVPLQEKYAHPKIQSFLFDLREQDYSFFDRFDTIDALMITAGFGHLAHFRDISEEHIIDSFEVNTLAALRLIKRFFPRIEGPKDFYCGVMVSMAGWMSSPLFSVYGATKAALKSFIESVNVELEKAGSINRILDVSPGSIKGTSFDNGKTDLAVTRDLTRAILSHLEAKDDLYIPRYEEIYKEVLQRYHADFRKEGLHSYDYKMNSGRFKG